METNKKGNRAEYWEEAATSLEDRTQFRIENSTMRKVRILQDQIEESTDKGMKKKLLENGIKE